MVDVYMTDASFRGRNERGLPISALLIAECSRVSVSVYWSSRIDRLETIK